MEWIEGFMSQDMQTVIYGDHASLPDLMVRWPPCTTRIYQFLPMEEFITAGWDWSKDAARDHERNHSVELYQIWNEKIFMVERAIGMNPYGSAAYVWVDIGCFREAGRKFAGFPEDRRLPRDRVLFLEVEPFTAAERRGVAKIDERFRFVNRIGGTMFGGGKELLLRFANLYFNLLTEAKREGVFAGKDQSMYAFAILREPSLFWTVPTDRGCSYDAWFYLHHYLSSPLATEKSQHDSMLRKGHGGPVVVLVGPGIMPIPPRGWGAVEILVWNMAEELKRRGWMVHILNSSDMVLVESEIRRIRPDFVHIQYDDYAHYGYLEQRERWGGYEQVFRRCIGIPGMNVYHFALSPGIADVYKMWGVPEDRIRVLHNGADASLFRYTDQPLLGDRSICVGKVEVRKAQYVVGHIPSVWIVGNRGDASFDYGHPRYLGEWAKEELYDRLTDYGNLVLLSDGEADPLVVKEALVAGLGVVVSEVAAANLDRGLPFVTVVPMDRVRDIGYLAEVIEANRRYAVGHRAEIRRYAERFHWSAVVNRYIEEIQKIIKNSNTQIQNV
jgi:glycosyltransferase involved in cell wall biosynthesis